MTNETGKRQDVAVLVAIAVVVALVHVLTNGRYGFHRDELQFLSDAKHLDWGFVAYPPLTPFVERISLGLFGLSLAGLRMFSVIAQAAALVLTGLMARELGGGRMAQVAAALSVALSILPMFEATEFQYTTFDYLWWVLIAYCVVRLLKTDDPRWWIPIGAAIGLGLMTKYSITFYIAGIVAGLVLSGARKYLASAWFWGGVALALLIFLPNFLWQVHHGFISYHFLQHIHVRDVKSGRGDGFLTDQLWICTNSVSVLLWIAGLVAYMRDRRYRMLGWMFLVPFALFFFSKGRGYYVAAAYPMLIAMGAVAAERWLASLRRGWARTVAASYFTLLALCGIVGCCIIIPLAASGPLRAFALDKNGDLREEFGWDEMVRTVAGIRDTLPPEQQHSLGIFTANYGEQGAVEVLGPKYGLPGPISATNSAWLRGYPTPQPTTLIVLGLSAKTVDRNFTNCRLAGHNGNSEGIKNEESKDHPDIFLCGSPRKSWPEFWEDFQAFG